MAHPYPKKFYYEEQSYLGDHYLIELADHNRLNVQRTSSCIPLLKESPNFATPTAKQWAAFEKNFYAIEIASLNQEYICDGTWIDIWITFRNRVKLSIQLGDTAKLRPLHLALNPLTKCQEYPRGLFF